MNETNTLVSLPESFSYFTRMSARILVVDDEPSIVDNIVYALDLEGFENGTASTLSEARSQLSDSTFDLLILDVGLPDGSGFDFCKEVREKLNIPIIFLTARSDEVDRVVGLEIGGDDYVIKPFSPRELVARVKVILRRLKPGIQNRKKLSETESALFEVDDYRKRIICQGTALQLSLYEFRILKILVKSPGRVYSRDQLMSAAWDDTEGSFDRAVDSHIKNLRQKLNPLFYGKEVIMTHRGLGYSLNETMS